MSEKLGKSFSYEANPADNSIFIGKAGPGQTQLNGELANIIVKCSTLPATNNVKNYMIIPYSWVAKQVAAYLFDFESQKFGNPFHIGKEPVVLLGASDAPEANFDPKLVNNYYRVSNGEFFNIGPVNYEWNNNWIMRPVTHILKVRLVALPQPGHSEPVYTFLSDKAMPINITSDKRFVVGTGTQIFTTKQFNVPLNQFFYLRLVYTRMPYTERYYDCSVEIEVVGFGRAGGDLKCKKNYNKTRIKTP